LRFPLLGLLLALTRFLTLGFFPAMADLLSVVSVVSVSTGENVIFAQERIPQQSVSDGFGFHAPLERNRFDCF
jgi:hypothetical protein